MEGRAADSGALELGIAANLVGVTATAGLEAKVDDNLSVFVDSFVQQSFGGELDLGAQAGLRFTW